MTGFFQFLAALFQMNDRVWERHTNPWSVWTRFAAFPFLMLALWSVHWIGWLCLIPTALVAAWLWLNPRMFPPPQSTQSWASRTVLGERVYLLRDMHAIPVEHSNAVTLLSIGAAVGTLWMAAGLIAAEPYAFVFGAVAAFFFKFWFADRMVWLFDEMSESVPEYRSWRR